MATEREYLSSVTLMLLSEELNPLEISAALKISPDQAWKKGEPKSKDSNSIHEYGGWKKFLPPEKKESPLEEQIMYWLRELRSQESVLKMLSYRLELVALDCFVTSDHTASIIIPADVSKSVANYGLELQLSFSVNEYTQGES